MKMRPRNNHLLKKDLALACLLGNFSIVELLPARIEALNVQLVACPTFDIAAISMQIMGGGLPKLAFYDPCGTNVALIENGIAMRKLNTAEKFNSVGFTNRPLENDEILWIFIGHKLYPHQPIECHNNPPSFCFGVTTRNPRRTIIPDRIITQTQHQNTRSFYEDYDHTVTFDGKNTWCNNKMTVPNYFDGQIMIGDEIGVKRSQTRAVHFYLNGKDLGPAASNIPEPVFGVFEICEGFDEARITKDLTFSDLLYVLKWAAILVIPYFWLSLKYKTSPIKQSHW